MRTEFSRPHYSSSSSSFRFFFIVALHTQIQAFAHLVEEISTAVFLVSFHIQIGIVAISLFDVHPEYPTEKSCQFIDCSFSVVDTTQLLQAVNQFDQLDERSRPTMRGFGQHWFFLLSVVPTQQIQFRIDITDSHIQEAALCVTCRIAFLGQVFPQYVQSDSRIA